MAEMFATPDLSHPEAFVLLFAILLASLAILGSLVGRGTIGRPIGSQAIDSYGWGVAINATAGICF